MVDRDRGIDEHSLDRQYANFVDGCIEDYLPPVVADSENLRAVYAKAAEERRTGEIGRNNRHLAGAVNSTRKEG